MTFKYENSYGGVGNNLELVGFYLLIVQETWSLESQLLDICGGVEVLCKKTYDYLFFHLKKIKHIT